jgi:hypothetical protein
MVEKNLTHLTKLDSNYDWNSDIDIMMNRSFRKVLLPIIRRVMPNVLAQQLIGVQPMAGPVGAIFSLRYGYGDYKLAYFIRNCTLEQYGGIEIDRL